MIARKGYLMKEKLQKHKKKLIALGVILVIVILIITKVVSCVNGWKETYADDEQQTALIERRELTNTVTANGKIVSLESKDVTANVSGVEVLTVDVEVGDTVEAGDVICTLDASDLQANLADVKTSLAATDGTMDINLDAAERSLSEAENARNIDVERANEDVAEAWDDYADALNDLTEAESDYEDAKKTTIEKKGEYELRQKMLEEAGAKLNGTNSGSTTAYESEFSSTLDQLKGYLSGQSLTTALDLSSYLYITNSNLKSVTADQLVTGSLTEDQKKAIDVYLGTLRGDQEKYNAALAAQANYAAVQAEYQSVQNALSEWYSKYTAAQSSESAAKSAYEAAQTAADNMLSAYKTKVRAKEDTVRTDDSTVASREDSLKTTQYSASISGLSEEQSIRQYEKQIDACTVTAPISGVVTAVNVDEGALYSGSSIVTIEDESAYEIEAQIDEYDIANIEEGQKVTFTTNATGDEELTGKVKSIAPRATSATTAAASSSSTVTYKVTMSIDKPNDALKMDMTAKLSIIVDSKDNVLSVPYDCIQTDEDGKDYIEVLSEDGTDAAAEGEAAADAANTRRIYVTTGLETDYYVEIISDEIEEGMSVLVPTIEQDDSDEGYLLEGF